MGAPESNRNVVDRSHSGTSEGLQSLAEQLIRQVQPLLETLSSDHGDTKGNHGASSLRLVRDTLFDDDNAGDAAALVNRVARKINAKKPNGLANDLNGSPSSVSAGTPFPSGEHVTFVVRAKGGDGEWHLVPVACFLAFPGRPGKGIKERSAIAKDKSAGGKAVGAEGVRRADSGRFSAEMQLQLVPFVEVTSDDPVLGPAAVARVMDLVHGAAEAMEGEIAPSHLLEELAAARIGRARGGGDGDRADARGE